MAGTDARRDASSGPTRSEGVERRDSGNPSNLFDLFTVYLQRSLRSLGLRSHEGKVGDSGETSVSPHTPTSIIPYRWSRREGP